MRLAVKSFHLVVFKKTQILLEKQYVRMGRSVQYAHLHLVISPTLKVFDQPKIVSIFANLLTIPSIVNIGFMIKDTAKKDGAG